MIYTKTIHGPYFLIVNDNVVGSKWIYQTNFHYDGTIERHKARLVAQGFIQIMCLHYSRTFRKFIKSSTMCILLSRVVINK